MRVITEDKEYDELWANVERICEFYSRRNNREFDKLFDFKVPYRKYSIQFYWGEKEERIVNSFFCHMGSGNIYGLVYNRDCFEFNPSTEEYYGKSWYDKKRDVNVFFPSYYPDRDYHFFVSKDFTYGMFGVPFKNELYITNKTFIELFDQNNDKLGLIEIM